MITQFNVQEQIFDYTFSHLGIDTNGSINHPILITEPVACPNYSRICKHFTFLTIYLCMCK